MTFENLILFRDIVQERSVSRGAALNGVSQPAASQHLREIEERMGVTLLDRSTRPFTLTPAGKLYFQMCRDVLQRHEEFQVSLEGLKVEVEGTVHIASIYSVGISEMARLKEEFSRRFPQANLEVEYLRPDKGYEAVLADRADLGFVSYPQASRLLAVIPFRQEQMAVVVGPSHPLAQRAAVRPKEIEGCSFVAFDEDLPIRQGIDRFLREQGVAVNVAMHFDNIQMIKEAVALGSGISVLPVRPLRAEIDRGRLVAIPFDSELTRPIGIIHRRRKKMHRAARCFLELLELQPAPAVPVLA